MNWKDTSSFSLGDKVRTPTTFTLIVSGLRVVVTRHIHAEPDEWLLHCEPWFHGVVVSKGSADEAKAVALEAVRKKLQETLAALTPNNEVTGLGRNRSNDD